MSKKKRNKLSITAQVGRGSIEVIIDAPHASVCKNCGAQIWWCVRADDRSRKVPVELVKRVEHGEEIKTWYAHNIFCPVGGVLARQKGQDSLL